MKKFQTLLLIAICLMVVSCKQSGNNQQETAANETVATNAETTTDDRGYIVEVGQQAPDFTVEYTDGRTQKLSDLRGKLIMIQFTASWCGVCRKEMPHIEKNIWLKHKDNPNFALIGIDLKEDKATTDKFAKDMNVTYPITLDMDGSRFALYTAPKAGVTRNIIIDKEGRIVLLTRLFEEKEFNGMVQFIDNYLENNF